MKFRYFVSMFFSFMLLSCATYTDKIKEIHDLVKMDSYQMALEKLEQTSIAQSSSDKVIYYMEKGYILFSMEEYEQAAKIWGKAQDEIDRLYTVSLSKQTVSMLTNDSATDYEGENHEKALLPVYAAFSYLGKNDIKGALVEARRTARALEQIKKENEGEGKYVQDAFPHFLTGIIFEMNENWDGAIIEYRRALNAYEKNKSWLQVSSLPIVKALKRLAVLRNRQNVLKDLNKKYDAHKINISENWMNKAEIIVIYQAGVSPVKRSEEHRVPVGNQIVSVAYPVFEHQRYISDKAEIFLNNKQVSSPVLMQDVGAIAQQALKDRRGKDLTRQAARIATKAVATGVAQKTLGDLGGAAFNILGTVTERADTRSWTLLPDKIFLRRIHITPDKEYTLKINPEFGKPLEKIIKLSSGEKKFVILRTFK